MNRLNQTTLNLLLCLICLSTSTTVIAQTPKPAIDHTPLTTLLEKHVNDEGHVNYTALQNDRQAFENYLAQLNAITKDELRTTTPAQQIAFWINAYNAFTLKAIIDNYPIEPRPFGGWFAPDNSIKQIKGVWTGLEFPVAGHSLTLDHMEHEILRKQFDEPRIHFAIVCASLSCPDLRREAYTGDQLEQQLAAQQQRFLSNPEKGLRIEGDELLISKIFDWFAEDFQTSGDNLPDFPNRSEELAGVLRYLYQHSNHPQLQQLLDSGDFRVNYLDYDWNLNEQLQS